MKKKKYCSPEIELQVFRLDGNILLSSIEHKPNQDGGGVLIDPPETDDPIEIGGLW